MVPNEDALGAIPLDFLTVTDAIRTPDELLEGLPEFPFEASYRNWEGLRLAHLDEGEGPPVVFFHGEPTWSFLWRKVIPPVRDAGFRCVAPDLPDAHLAMARSYRASHDYDRALVELSGMGIPRDKAEFSELLALGERRHGHWKDARLYESSDRLKAESADGFYLL